MTPKYFEERKAAIFKKQLPPNNKNVSEIAAEEYISKAALYNQDSAAILFRRRC
ncbi:hypothetical protein [Salinivibrio sp. ML323]|uniref:hypothetical protein n=1 Tax=Salinivibrio sp. ML323 TaxID=1909474 RepID=UPI001300E9C6|nr:hypothetical protein [Salinivibrio sp. ML323]